MFNLCKFLVVIAFVLMSGQRCFAQTDSEPKARLIVLVNGVDGKPIAGASVEVFKWTRTWNKTKHNGLTTSDGKATFQGVPSNAYMTAVVRADGYAALMNDFQLVGDETRSMTCKLGRPARSFVLVTDANGNPIPNAEFSRLEITDASGVNFTVGGHDAKLLDPSMQPSDELGRLYLPTVSEGSTINAEVVHPKWASNRIEEIKVVNGKAGSTTLPSGTTLDVKLKTADGKFVSPKDGSILELRFIPAQDWNKLKDEKVGQGLIHSYKLDDHRFGLTLHSGQYTKLSAAMDGYVVTPDLNEGIKGMKLVTPIIMFNGKSGDLPLVVRRKIPISGRVVRNDGTPVSGVYIDVETENIVPESMKHRFEGILPWTTADFVTTDEEGRFKANAPAGKIRCSPQFSNYYSDSREQVYEVEEGKNSVVPDLVINPMPNVLGKVVDSVGKPVANCIVRRKMAVGTTSYKLTNESGEFELQIARFPYDQKLNKQVFADELIAFTADDDRGASIKVDLKDPKDFEYVNLTLESKPESWQIDVFKQPEVAVPEQHKETFAKRQLKFAKGLAGESVDNMSSGTWLNTSAKSLDDFKGRYVLLDFWFIGCGPCERDMPSLAKAQKLFVDHDFTVVSVHINTQTPENVAQFAKANKMHYPIVVDGAEGLISERFKEVGVSGYPSYILLDPDGKIVVNDGVTVGPLSLRSHKLELIKHYLMEKKN